jgi:hypothetical protein
VWRSAISRAFRTLGNPGKVIYRFDEVLLLCLLSVLAGAETFVDIARFGEKKLDLLRRFRPFRHGTPSHDHLGDIFATLDAEEFQRRAGLHHKRPLPALSASLVAMTIRHRQVHFLSGKL